VARAPEVSETQTPLATSDFFQAGLFVETDEVKQQVSVPIEARGEVPVQKDAPSMGQCVARRNNKKGPLAEVGDPLLTSETVYMQSVRCQSGVEGVNVSDTGNSISLMSHESLINTANYPQSSPTHDAAAFLAAHSSLSMAQSTKVAVQPLSFSPTWVVHDQGLKRPRFALDTNGTNTASGLIGLLASHQPPANLSKKTSRSDGEKSCKRIHRDQTDGYETSAFEEGVDGEKGSEMDNDQYIHHKRKELGIQEPFCHTHPPLSSRSSLPYVLHSLSTSLSSSQLSPSSLSPPTAESS